MVAPVGAQSPDATLVAEVIGLMREKCRPFVTGSERVKAIDPQVRAPVVIDDRSRHDRYNDPGRPLTKRLPHGASVARRRSISACTGRLRAFCRVAVYSNCSR